MPAKKNTPATPETVHVATGTKAPATEKRKAVIGFAEKHGFNVDSFCHETGLDDRYAIPVAEAAADHLTGLGFTVDSGRGFVAGGPAPAQEAAAPAATARIAVVREPGITTAILTPPDVTVVSAKAGDDASARANNEATAQDRILAALLHGPLDMQALVGAVNNGKLAPLKSKEMKQARTALVAMSPQLVHCDETLGTYGLHGEAGMLAAKVAAFALSAAEASYVAPTADAPRAKRAPKVIPAAVDGVLTLEKEVGNSVNGAYITIKVGDAFKPGQKVRVAISLAV